MVFGNSSPNLNEQEVQRRVAAVLQQKNQEIAELRGIIADCQNTLIHQKSKIEKLTADPLLFGTLLKVQGYPDPAVYAAGDDVFVTDRNSPHYLKAGKIVRPADANGLIIAKLTDGVEQGFFIGLQDRPPAQVQLLTKNDGTSAVVSMDGKAWEVRGIPNSGLQVGNTVKLRADNKAVVDLGNDDFNTGPICKVLAINEAGVEVFFHNDVVLVYNPHNFALEEGDRVVCDHGMFCVLRKLEKDNRQRYKVSEQLNVGWDQVGGLESAKQQLRDIIELPLLQPELFRHYKIQQSRGFLLYGPTGTGKTLLARVCACEIAKLYGKSALESGYIYVKSPELLSKWVGETEAEIRLLFEKSRKHYREHGYRAMLVFDEADAIMPQRGSRRSSDIADTMVPMFLGEMDGVDTKQTQENPIVVLLTNRADILDPAIVRDGRIDKHIKIDRPTELTAIDILDIHTKDIPFAEDRRSALALTTADLFSKSRLLYRINGQYEFTLGDAVNGAILENLAATSKMIALHRDLRNKTQTGVKIEDMREAVKRIYTEQGGLNHNFDVSDFCEKHHLQSKDVKIDRCFGSC